MTSGQFTSFPISQIFVNRPERQRRQLEKIDELAASISRTGLIHPPVIERSGELRVGERRLEACKQLGWTHIPVQYVDELDEPELQLLELEENVRRVDLPWPDRCLAIERYYALRAASDAEWTDAKTANALGFTQQHVTDCRNVAKELLKGNQEVLSADRYSTAKNIVVRSKERQRLDTLHSLQSKGVLAKPQVPILNLDFNKWANEPYDGPLFNFIHCDFPYGIGANKFDQGSAQEMGGYEDTKETLDRLMNSLDEITDARTQESAHLMFWFSMKYYTEIKEALEEMTWRIWPHPLIWHKSDNVGIIPDPQRGPRQMYETCFFGSRGDRLITRAVNNIAAAPTTQSIHMSEKPVNMLAYFMSMFVDDTTIMLDPTCGSASSLHAAQKLKAKYVLGLEINEGFYKDACAKFY